MHMFKKIGSWVAVGFLGLFLMLALVVLPVSMELTNRQAVKSWIGDSGVLEGISEVSPLFFAQIQGGSEDDEEEIDLNTVEKLLEGSGIDTSQLVTASQTVLTPEYIKEKLFPTIDGFYDWLEGETPSPVFEVVLSDRLTALADAISKPLTSEINKLPVCPTNTVYDTEFNPITAQCVPPGLNVDQLISDYSGSLTDVGDTPDIVFSSDDLEMDESVLETGPRVFSIVNNLPLYLGGLILVFSALAVFLAKSVKHGLKRVSWVFIIYGVVVGISYWIIGNTGLLVRTSDLDAPQVVIDSILTPITETILGDIAQVGILLSLISISIGAAIWLSSFIHHKITHANDGYAKVRDTSPSEKSETKYVNKISK